MFSLLAANGAKSLSRRQLHRLGFAGMVSSNRLSTLLANKTASPHKAKRCIYIYLCGGPSQLDLWDPKPDAVDGIRSEFKPIETNVPGIMFTELIPNLAKHASKLALIRSMTHTSTDHNISSAHTLHGYPPIRPDDVYAAPTDHPAIGAILHKLKGDTGLLPPWVILPRPFTTASPPIKGQSGGFLGSRYDAVSMNETKQDSLAPKDLKFSAFELPPGVGESRLKSRRQLLSKLDDRLKQTNF